MKILISGCSFTALTQNGKKKNLPDYLPGEVERYSEHGAGNIYIVRSLLSRLQELKNLGNLSDVKVICQLSYIHRYDLYLRNLDEIDKYKKANRIGLRNTYAWWIFGLYIWNILDAYVDSHLSTFPIKRLDFNHEQDSLRVSKE